MAEHPAAKTREVVDGLATQGIRVSANHVYLLKSQSNAKRRKARGTKLRAVAASRPAIRDYADAVQQVKILAHRLGGISALKALVDVLAE
jgi:hypothetical protein